MTRSLSFVAGGVVSSQSKSAGSLITDLPSAETSRPRGSRCSRSPLIMNMYSSPGLALATSAVQMPVSLSIVILSLAAFQLLKLPTTETVSAWGAQTRNVVPVILPVLSRCGMAPSWSSRIFGMTAAGVGVGASAICGAGVGAGFAISAAATSRRVVAS